MAFFSKMIIATTAFAALSAALPLANRGVTEVVTETAYTTVDVPVTLWVDQNGKPLYTAGEGGNFAAQPTPEAESSKVLQSSASPSSPVAQAQVVPTTTPAPVPAPVPQVTTTPSVPTTTAAPQLPAYTPPTNPSSPAPAPAQTNSGQSGQSSGACVGSGSGCTGDITHWDGGLGACGWNVNTESDMQIALPVGLMGSQSNGNPYCGKSLTIKNPDTGKTVQATVGDKCMGCTGNSIDLTNALFNAVGGGCDGRCSGFEWWFN